MTRSVFNAAYLAIFIWFIRKLARKAIVPKVPNWERAPFRYIFTAPMMDFELLQGGSNSYAKVIAMADGNDFILKYYRYNGFHYVNMDSGKPLDKPVGTACSTDDDENSRICRNTGCSSTLELDALCHEINTIQGF